MDSLEVARKHFASALKLNPDNLRALYGFCLVRQPTLMHNAGSNANITHTNTHTQASHALTTHSKIKGKGEVKVKNTRFIDWAKSQLKQKYQFVSTCTIFKLSQE